MIVLDTDHLSCLEWGSDESATRRERLAAAVDQPVVVSIVSYKEQMRGWMASSFQTMEADLLACVWPNKFHICS